MSEQGLDIDSMPPDELRRRLRDALLEVEALKTRVSPPPVAATAGGFVIAVRDFWAVPSTTVTKP
jgi:hypothetical protein